jgi:hypothetical protein
MMKGPKGVDHSAGVIGHAVKVLRMAVGKKIGDTVDQYAKKTLKTKLSWVGLEARNILA